LLVIVVDPHLRVHCRLIQQVTVRYLLSTARYQQPIINHQTRTLNGQTPHTRITFGASECNAVD
jgi:hypothetical protein